MEFNTELLLISSKYPRDQVQILNAAGSGEQFNTNKIDAKGNLIFVQGLPAPPATLDNMRRALVNQLNNGKTDSFIFITGHGGRGDVASATPSGAQLQTYQYSELVSKIISRPNKDKKVKLNLTRALVRQFSSRSEISDGDCSNKFPRK